MSGFAIDSDPVRDLINQRKPTIVIRDKAIELARVVTGSQQVAPVGSSLALSGFFYTGPDRDTLFHQFHRAADQAPIVALSLLHSRYSTLLRPLRNCEIRFPVTTSQSHTPTPLPSSACSICWRSCDCAGR